MVVEANQPSLLDVGPMEVEDENGELLPAFVRKLDSKFWTSPQATSEADIAAVVAAFNEQLVFFKTENYQEESEMIMFWKASVHYWPKCIAIRQLPKW